MSSNSLKGLCAWLVGLMLIGPLSSAPAVAAARAPVHCPGSGLYPTLANARQVAKATLCLIDGYFDHRPAVRHKELLLLLARGARIFGAASIGALRAAEMDSFGMIGVGAIFAAYARGSLTGDDEVALIHAGPERDWRPMSVPLVDVRASLCAARRASILGRGEARALLRAAAAIHYVDRQWPAICEVLADAGTRAAFETWLETGAVSQKRADALACLDAAIHGGARPCEPPLPVHTCFLDALARARGIDPAAIRP
jgi:hypothetical protein